VELTPPSLLLKLLTPLFLGRSITTLAPDRTGPEGAFGSAGWSAPSDGAAAETLLPLLPLPLAPRLNPPNLPKRSSSSNDTEREMLVG